MMTRGTLRIGAWVLGVLAVLMVGAWGWWVVARPRDRLRRIGRVQ